MINRPLIQFAIILLTLCATTPATALPNINHVIHISIDGLSADRFQQLILISPENYPNIIRLQNQGASTFNARIDTHSTFTNPNHADMLTARPAAQPNGAPNTTHHGLLTNSSFSSIHTSGNTNLPYIKSTFDIAHDHGKSTAFYYTKTKFHGFTDSYNSINGAPDTIGPDNGKGKIDSFHYNQFSGSMLDNFVTDMTANHFNYSFLHFAELDNVGHASGWDSSTWDDTTLAIDAHVGKLLRLIENDPILNNHTAIIFTADHGGEQFSHLEPNSLNVTQIPLMIWAPGIPQGVDAYTLFSNRTDPGLAIPDYNQPDQPLRNGDTANLALNLINLPPIDNSYFLPQLNIPEPTSLLALSCIMVIFSRFPHSSKR